ncbi:hypothetical protein SORBI_3001G361750 [Sorghum bicolor]|uniref:Uncharacterized protein n=1 Tax=Sorghum bicolor TaxID=4558 RepID=A0A1Z5S9G3_SORBI|nr:hypothetical protein SORBI_3001G361750 [Sorghum bicolor]OQU92548.1 hypothetical protein SORBI_3001G361750 [Sorghum bicolor]OQU92549.1 hypothetical protein SORBI_3001G361750 [Sorghum bicolor]OQU92550.1 hypothetical protein SORBI_3001G361750 [Sorghum bicolor]
MVLRGWMATATAIAMANANRNGCRNPIQSGFRWISLHDADSMRTREKKRKQILGAACRHRLITAGACALLVLSWDCSVNGPRLDVVEVQPILCFCLRAGERCRKGYN